MTNTVTYVSLDEATTPRDGPVLTNRWWIYKPDQGIIFVNKYPQCNQYQRPMESVRKLIYPDAELIHLDVVFIPQRLQWLWYD